MNNRMGKLRAARANHRDCFFVFVMGACAPAGAHVESRMTNSGWTRISSGSVLPSRMRRMSVRAARSPM